MQGTLPFILDKLGVLSYHANSPIKEELLTTRNKLATEAVATLKDVESRFQASKTAMIAHGEARLSILILLVEEALPNLPSEEVQVSYYSRSDRELLHKLPVCSSVPFSDLFYRRGTFYGHRCIYGKHCVVRLTYDDFCRDNHSPDLDFVALAEALSRIISETPAA